MHATDTNPVNVARLPGLGYADVATWDEVRQEIRAKPNTTHALHGQARTPRVYTIELYHFDAGTPLGMLWYEWTADNQLVLKNILVDDKFRRCGVGKLLVQHLIDYALDFEGCQRIITGRVTEASGPLLEGLGFKYEFACDCWVLYPRKVDHEQT